MDEKFNPLLLENQLCFPLYACAKEIVRRYKPFLDPLDLTYTQYITMMVMWDKKSITVKDLGEKLMLDSGTLTPLLKKLEAKGYITRQRSLEDERSVDIIITKAGEDLREQALNVPMNLGKCIPLSVEEMVTLKSLLTRLMATLENENKN